MKIRCLFVFSVGWTSLFLVSQLITCGSLLAILMILDWALSGWSVFAMLGDPKIGHMHRCRSEVNNHFCQPAGYTFAHEECVVSLNDFKGATTAPVRFARLESILVTPACIAPWGYPSAAGLHISLLYSVRLLCLTFCQRIAFCSVRHHSGR